MLKEFSQIAREMLFLHGHLTRPQDWSEGASAKPAAAAQDAPKVRPARRVGKTLFALAATDLPPRIPGMIQWR